ncbi:MAG: hypothetical protein Q7T22_08030 [Serpentinimonas sp.]|nr:hypothetical protein [Serpentinimonas sp.]MDO9611418.1 hypothetical protein [Serpentinimonas sp.]
MTRIPVNPDLLTWACQRAGLESLALAGKLNSGATKPREGNP